MNLRYRMETQESLKLEMNLKVIRKNRSPGAFECISRTLLFTIKL